MIHKTFPMGVKELPVKFRPVIDYATNSLMKSGIRNFTVERMCADLRISKKTVYKHFQTKEELVEAILYDSFQKLFSAVKSTPKNEQNPLEYVFLTIKTIFDHVGANGPEFIYDIKFLYPRIWDEIDIFQTSIIQNMRDSFVDAQKTGMIRSDINIDFTLHMMLKVAQSIFQPEFLIHSPFSVRTIMIAFVDIFMNGVIEEGRKFDLSFLRTVDSRGV